MTLAEDLTLLATVVHAMPGKQNGCVDPECFACKRQENQKRAASEALARVHALAVAAAAQVEAGRAGTS